MYLQSNQPLPPLKADELGAFDERLNPLLEKALAKDPNNRFQSMAEFAMAIERLDSTWQNSSSLAFLQAPQRKGNTPPEKRGIAQQKKQKSKTHAVLAVVLILLGLAFTGAFFIFSTAEKNKEPSLDPELEKKLGKATGIHRIENTIDSIEASGGDPTQFIDLVLERKAKILSKSARSGLLCRRALICRNLPEAFPFIEKAYDYIGDDANSEGNENTIQTYAYLCNALRKFDRSTEAGFKRLHALKKQWGQERMLTETLIIATDSALRNNRSDDANKLMSSALENRYELAMEADEQLLEIYLALNLNEQLKAISIDTGTGDLSKFDAQLCAAFACRSSDKHEMAADFLKSAHISQDSISKKSNKRSDMVLALELEDLEQEKSGTNSEDEKKSRLRKICKDYLNYQKEHINELQIGAEQLLLSPRILLHSLIQSGLFSEADSVMSEFGFYDFKPLKHSYFDFARVRAVAELLKASSANAEAVRLYNKLPQDIKDSLPASR